MSFGQHAVGLPSIVYYSSCGRLHGPTVLPLATIAATRVDPAATAQAGETSDSEVPHKKEKKVSPYYTRFL